MQQLARSLKPALAYCNVVGKKTPGVVFLPGFMSNMNGQKAIALEGWCRENDHSFVRFDYRGTGSSEGPFQKYEDWIDDAVDVMTNLTTGQQVVIGSSMGANIMLQLSKNFPERMAGMIGVAPSFYFCGNLRSRFESVAQIEDGVYIFPSSVGSYKLPVSFVDDIGNHDLFRRNSSFDLPCPLTIIHGMMDEAIPWKMSLEFVETQLSNTSRDVQLTYRKHGDHRLSTNDDIRIIINALQCMIGGLALNSNM